MPKALLLLMSTTMNVATADVSSHLTGDMYMLVNRCTFTHSRQMGSCYTRYRYFLGSSISSTLKVNMASVSSNAMELAVKIGALRLPEILGVLPERYNEGMIKALKGNSDSKSGG